MKKRLFVGFQAERDVCEQARAWRMDYSQLPVKWLEDKNLHFTVVPPWDEADPDKAARQLDQLSGMFSASSVNLDVIELGPDSRAPRLIWAKGEATDGLKKAVREIHRALEKKLPTEEYRLHLTIARFQPEKFRDFPLRSVNARINWQANIRSICLYQARQGSYEIIKKVEL